MRSRRPKSIARWALSGLLPLLVSAALADPQTGLPSDMPAAVDLGRKIFMDRRLSGNGTMSCGMCHVPEQGFTVNEMATAIGIEGRSLRRNAPTLLDVVAQRWLFHDGRETSLERQVWGPLLAPDEMGNTSRASVVERLNALPDYTQPFLRAFPGIGVTEDTIAVALASYERALATTSSRFDRWYLGGDVAALNASERAGFELFRGKAGCSACHSVDLQQASFTDHRFHNTGIGWRRAEPEDRLLSVPLGAGQTTEVSAAQLAAVFGASARDEGRFEVTGRAEDRWAYKTPSLRNVSLTSPYMHDGSLSTLQEVIEFYDKGGIANAMRDPLLRPLHLDGEEKEALESFLHTLTGANAAELAREARAAFHAIGAR